MSHPDDRQRESRRIIERADTQVDGGAMAGLRRSADRARGHMAGDDVDQHDPVELWATRVGRTLSLVLLVVLVWWLAGSFGITG